MKILKNIFGSKPKQNTKYEPNTLAEMNGSPDLRLATAKEKEVDIPLPKTEEVKKISKSSTKSSAQKSTTSAYSGASPKKATPSATKTTAKKQVSSTNKSTQKNKADIQNQQFVPKHLFVNVCLLFSIYELIRSLNLCFIYITHNSRTKSVSFFCRIFYTATESFPYVF